MPPPDSYIKPVRPRRRWWPWFVLPLLLAVGGMYGYVRAALWWSYSEGERVGVLQKVSRKGWLCKTYEGELAMYVVGGVAPQIWDFSTRSEEVAKQLSAAVGQNVQLHYTEHRGIPSSCFAETPYLVQGLKIVRDLPPPAK
jgi:hypothetical protein